MLSEQGQLNDLLACRNWSIELVFSAMEVLLNEDVWPENMWLSNILG
jgi:hypothetical protein